MLKQFYFIFYYFLLCLIYYYIISGGILIDEMKLAENIHFEKHLLEISGFVDLGKHIPNEQQNMPGDHALVLIYQPLEGSWYQAIGAFLSRNAAPGDILHNIILEAIILMENSGFKVDYIVSDGATWNRSMWRHFGVGLNNLSCEHIFDETRKLWFLSDFPHLIKNVRNWLVQKQEILVRMPVLYITLY